MLNHFLSSFRAYNVALVAGTSSQENGDVLAHAMKFIIIPLISRSFELKQHEIVNEAAVNTMRFKVLSSCNFCTLSSCKLIRTESVLFLSASCSQSKDFYAHKESSTDKIVYMEFVIC